MSVASKQLREQRKPLGAKIRELSDRINTENRDFTAEETGEWEKVNGEYNALTRRIEIAEAAERTASDSDERSGDPGRGDTDGRRNAKSSREERTQPTDEDRALSLQAWMRSQLGLPLKKRHAEACRRTRVRVGANTEYVVRLRSGQAPNSARELRALSAINLSTGGATVPEGFVSSLELALLQFGGMRQVADVMRTSSGNPLPWPTANDTSNTGEMIGESQSNNSADPSLGAITFQAYKFSSKFVKVPTELLEDSAFDMASQIGAMLGERLGRIGNTKQTVGTGANQPTGAVTAATLGVTAASATAIVADELLSLERTIDPAYRSQGCGYMMHDNTILLLRKLKDGDGQYIWRPGMDMGDPDRLNGYPVTINQDMAQVATGTKTVLFGQFKKFKIREVAEIRMVRLVERYAEYDQQGFIAFQRFDSNLLDAGTHPLKYLIQA